MIRQGQMPILSLTNTIQNNLPVSRRMPYRVSDKILKHLSQYIKVPFYRRIIGKKTWKTLLLPAAFKARIVDNQIPQGDDRKGLKLILLHGGILPAKRESIVHQSLHTDQFSRDSIP